MSELIGGIAAGVYSAFTGLALAAQGLAGALPHQASVVVSVGVAAVSFWLGRASARVLRLK